MSRELMEESTLSVKLDDLLLRAKLEFKFPAQPAWNHLVKVFVAENWSGIAHETEEIQPLWFSVSEIPYDRMWADTSYWLPLVLNQQLITGSFVYRDDNQKLSTTSIQINDC